MKTDKIKRHVASLLWKFKKKADVNVSASTSSYCYPKNDGYFIQVGERLASGLARDKAEQSLLLKGLASHEVAHILYTNFNTMAKIRTKQNNFQNSIKGLAKRYLDGESEISEEILKAIYGYVYYKNLGDLLNSYEDAAIEHYIPMDFPKTFEGIILLRNLLTQAEKKTIAKYAESIDGTTYSEELLSFLITEIRHCAVIGYRAPNQSFDLLSKKGVKKYLKKYKITNKKVKLIKQLGIHARLMTTSTEEREIDCMAVMSIIEPLVQEKAMIFYCKYMATINDENAFDNASGGFPNQKEELSILKKSSKGSPLSSIQSEYTLEAPDDVQKEIDKAKEKKEKEENVEKDGQPSSSSSEGKSESQNNEKNKEGDSDSKSKNENNEDGEGSSGESEDEKNKEGDGIGDSEVDCDDMDSIVSEFGSQKSVEEQADEALKSVEKELKSLSKKNETENVKEMKKTIEDGSGKAPIDLTDGANWTKTKIYTYSTIKKNSKNNSCNIAKKKELGAYANKFSQRLKKKILYASKTKILRGQLQGKINTGSIFRVKNDGRICKTKEVKLTKKARFSILVDQSGSMSGTKMNKAIDGAYMMALALQKIKIPYELCGHNFDDCCDYYKYVDFNGSKSPINADNIYLAESGGGNHDSAAIYQSLCSLAKAKEANEHAILIVISDGAPAAGNYGGKKAYSNIQALYSFFEKQYGIKTIGLGIGKDTGHVPLIYKDYLLTPNVSTLGMDLLKIIEDVIK